MSEIQHDISDKEIKMREKEITQKKNMSESIKNETYYRLVLRSLGEKDITPYGEDILKRRSF